MLAIVVSFSFSNRNSFSKGGASLIFDVAVFAYSRIAEIFSSCLENLDADIISMASGKFFSVFHCSNSSGKLSLPISFGSDSFLTELNSPNSSAV